MFIGNNALLMWIFATTLFTDKLCSAESDISEINDFLRDYEKRGTELYNNNSRASWNYETDMTEENKEEMKKWSAKSSEFSLRSSKIAKSLLKEVDVSDVPPSKLRQLKLIKRTASSRSDAVNKEYSDMVSKMTSIYSDTKMTKKGSDKEYSLEKDILPIMPDISKANLEDLQWGFTVVRDTIGKKIKPLYTRYVELANKGAKDNGYQDYGHYWREEYEDDDLEQSVEDILKDITPLYKKLHAFVRYSLNDYFGVSVIDKSGMIPIHLLNMWGQNWSHLYKFLTPYPKLQFADVTEEMKKKRWQTIDLLKVAESFFVSLGLEKMPQKFFEKSLIKRIPGKNPICFPSSFDLGNADVRIKMPCMSVSQGDMITVHHEMGHIEYYLMYKDQPLEFRTAANPGFHEAVGDVISLSVMTTGHLKSIDEVVNFLLKQALDHVAFIPFSYIVDKWRWAVFAKNITPEEYNTYWWYLRNRHQGITIPKDVEREDKNLCDPATFFHVPHDTEYLRYFYSSVLQFQFHKALCDEAGVGPPYHECSIHNSTQAGAKLRDMLQLGKKLPWKDTLKVLTGTSTISAQPLLEYFKPLEDWLDEHREKHNYELGWEQEIDEATIKLVSTYLQKVNDTK